MTAGVVEPGSAFGAWPTFSHSTSFGLGIHIEEGAWSTALPRFADVLHVSKLGAEAGFDVLWFSDHFCFDDESGPRGAWEVWTLIAAVAALVPDVRIGTGVACTGYRNPGVIARMVETIQEISGGRFILGLGAGWNKPEFDRFGLPFEPRVSRFDEAIQIISGLLRAGVADVEGRYFRATNAHNLPRTETGPGTPLLVGTGGSRMMRLLARYGDAWDTNWEGDFDRLRADLARLDDACRVEGRDPARVVRSVGFAFAEQGNPDDPGDMVLATDAEKVKFLIELAELGFQHIRIGLMPFSSESVEALAPVLAAFHNHSNSRVQ